ncbi:MAG: outer spore coat protein CotE [Bacilli bacterium]|nr:outer spore coat protein CotE [Bacilli bacterium]
MNDIREIVTRAVLAKGRKKFKLKETVLVNSDVSSVLGCWIINHQFTTELNNKEVILTGQFENNIWYSADNNSRTDVARSTTEYNGTVKVKEVLNDNISDHCDVVARILQQPTCTNALITNDGIEIDITFEVLVEVIGETKMMVNVVSCNHQEDDLDMLENEINEDFLESR